MESRRSSNRPSQRGSALPVALIVLVILSILAAATLRASMSSTRIAGIIQDRSRAFAYAATVTAAALQFAEETPALLPAAGPGIVLAPLSTGRGGADGRLRMTGTDTFCPQLAPLPAIRTHYEITVHAHAGRGAEIETLQGFAVCRETCTPPCTAMETRARRTYWSVR